MDAFHIDFAREQSRHLAARLLGLRRQRISRLRPVDGSGPAWDLMLALTACKPSRRPSLAELAEEAAVPRTTTYRWLRELQKHDFVILSGDDRDGRVVRVQLTASGEAAMHSIFASAGLQPA